MKKRPRSAGPAHHGRSGVALGAAAFAIGLLRAAFRRPDLFQTALLELFGLGVFYLLAGWAGGAVYGVLWQYRTSAVRAAMIGFVEVLIPCALLIGVVNGLSDRYSGMGWEIVPAWLFASAVVGCGGGLIDWFVRKLVERQFGVKLDDE